MKDLIELVRAHGAAVYRTNYDGPIVRITITPKDLAAFAEAIRAEERERCAAECERMVMCPGGRQESAAHQDVWHAAKAIRAMKEPKP
jgi:hypothetical protein